ncbi:long-chain fatty acid--CoA ligase [Vibrio diazotrophicus]|uniref:long-chain fatty acid--CoA ligase n=1 Tax=Vibrio diazotrophicus TaxID=685 RepID=UPI00142D682E|nr:long-chain fatty acid--CoA ligase [Vibrio diazotrophicus]NIY91404.1 long-chain fatty acid--CoA ligase [Vibrio diazotrophicus]
MLLTTSGRTGRDKLRDLASGNFLLAEILHKYNSLNFNDIRAGAIIASGRPRWFVVY